MSNYDSASKLLLFILPFSGRWSVYYFARRVCRWRNWHRGWLAMADFEVGLYDALTNMGQLKG